MKLLAKGKTEQQEKMLQRRVGRPAIPVALDPLTARIKALYWTYPDIPINLFNSNGIRYMCITIKKIYLLAKTCQVLITTGR